MRRILEILLVVMFSISAIVKKHKQLFVLVLGILIGIFIYNLYINTKVVKIEPVKKEVVQPKEEVVQPVIKQPEVTKPKEVSKPKIKSTILKATEKNGVWSIKLNKAAVDMVKNKGLKVRLQIGYCYYESDQLQGDTIQIEPEWHPPLSQNKVVAGLWMPKTGPSDEIGDGYYLMSDRLP
jgi:hypothetical protein